MAVVDGTGTARAGFPRARAVAMLLVGFASPSRAMPVCHGHSVATVRSSGRAMALPRATGHAQVVGPRVRSPGTARAGFPRAISRSVALVAKASPLRGAYPRAIGRASILLSSCTGVARAGFPRTITGTVVLNFTTSPARGLIPRAFGHCVVHSASTGKSRVIAVAHGLARYRLEVSGTARALARATGGGLTKAHSPGTARVVPTRDYGLADTRVACTGHARALARTTGRGSTSPNSLQHSPGRALALPRAFGLAEAKPRAVSRGTARVLAVAHGLSRTRVPAAGVSQVGFPRALGKETRLLVHGRALVTGALGYAHGGLVPVTLHVTGTSRAWAVAHGRSYGAVFSRGTARAWALAYGDQTRVISPKLAAVVDVTAGPRYEVELAAGSRYVIELETNS